MFKFMAIACMLTVIAAPVRAADFKDAVAAFKEKDYYKTITILDEHLKEHPKDFRGFALRGWAFVETEQHDKGLADLDKAMSEGKGDRGIDHYYRGRARTAYRKLEEAIEDFDKAIEINPKVADWYVARGIAYQYRPDSKRAMADFEKAVGLNPKNAEAWAQLGAMRLEIACEYEDRTFVNTKGDKTYVQRFLTSVKDKAGVDQAVSDLSRAIELNANDSMPVYRRMSAYKVLGNKGKERIADLRTLCRLMPEDSQLWNDLAWDLSTHFLASLRNGKEAVEAAEKAVRITERKNSLLLDTLAASYAEAGNFEKAVATETEAIEKNNHAETKAAFEKRLELYKSGKPFHRVRASKKTDSNADE